MNFLAKGTMVYTLRMTRCRGTGKLICEFYIQLCWREEGHGV